MRRSLATFAVTEVLLILRRRGRRGLEPSTALVVVVIAMSEVLNMTSTPVRTYSNTRG